MEQSVCKTIFKDRQEFIHSYLKNFSELEIYLSQLQESVDNANQEADRLRELIKQHEKDKVIKDEDGDKITDKANIRIYLDHIEVKDTTNNYNGVCVNVKLGEGYVRLFKFKKKEANKYFFDESLEM